MAFDEKAVERVLAEAGKVFISGLRNLAAAAAKEADLERQRLSEEARALAKDRTRLEEAWNQLNVERARLECSTGASTGIVDVNVMSPPRRVPPRSVGSLASPRREYHSPLVPLPLEELSSSSALGSYAAQPASIVAQGSVPGHCSMALGRQCFSVLPLQAPAASSLGHDMWNHIVELPEGWEIYSAADRDFEQVIAALTKHRWGAMVLGVKNVHHGYDAYWTPLFGDGSHAGQRCQEDVDWIEPVVENPRRFRMTYSGLRMVICQRAPSQPQPPTALSPLLAATSPGPPPLVVSPLAPHFAASPTMAAPQPGAMGGQAFRTA